MHLTVTCTCQSKITESAHELSYGADEVMSSSRTLVGLISGQWQNGWLDFDCNIFTLYCFDAGGIRQGTLIPH